MQHMFTQLEPPRRSNTMQDVGVPMLVVGATLLGSIIAAIILGTIHIIGFNLLVLILVCVMLVITAFFAWYSIRTRQKLQEQYNRDRAAIYTDYQQFNDNWQIYFDNEKFRWDDWAVNYSRKNLEEQTERSEESKKQCMGAIADAENRIATDIKNTETILTSTVKSYEGSLDSQKQYLIQTMQPRLDAIAEVNKQLDERIEDVNRNLSTRVQNNWNSITDWENTHNVTHGEEQKIYKHQLEVLEEKFRDKPLEEEKGLLS